MLGMFAAPRDPDEAKEDTAETIIVSPLALLKMLRHGRAGVPIEVMGLMLGRFVDAYTIWVADVFAMPQSGTGVSVEAVDPVYQKDMLDMLAATGRGENVVGWYHSHPGFGCWLSGVDQSTHQSFEQLDPRCVALVVDPIQSVRGKVVIDAFRLIPSAAVLSGREPRQTTTNTPFLCRPSPVALLHGLNRQYYSLPVRFSRGELEQRVLLSLGKKKWTAALGIQDFGALGRGNAAALRRMAELAELLRRRVEEEEVDPERRALQSVGKIDPQKHMQEEVSALLTQNILQILGTMLDTIAF